MTPSSTPPAPQYPTPTGEPGGWPAREYPAAGAATPLAAVASEVDAIGLAHDVAQGLCPVAMAPDGLLPALERLCREVRDQHGIACDLKADRTLAIQNPEHALHLYRIAREAVTNSIKHARCSRVAITLEQSTGAFTLEIADDGQGAVPGAIPVAGLGLSIMKYRAKLIGGVLRVAADASGGIRVTCRLPGLEVAP